MSTGYRVVQWSRHKRVYDATAAFLIVGFLAAYVLIAKARHTGSSAFSDEVLIIRALGACAFVLLHLILCIGPLARLEPRLLPVLYNRRHLGVMTFLVALAHATLVLGYYHGFGVANPLVSMLSTNISFFSFRAFPFQLLGLGGLLVMLVMAVTSHDFWLKNLSPRTWKSLHMAIYPAYAMLIGHVALGALQSDRGWVSFALTLFGAVTVISLHIAAGLREARFDRQTPSLNDAGSPWIDVGAIEDLPEDRARTVCAGGERIAVFKHKGQVSAVTNVCAHQGGPLGEGKIIDGCITCPWHGWQYRPADGRSPPPFQEKIATYQVRIVAGRVQVDPRALPPGTPTKPASVEPGHA